MKLTKSYLRNLIMEEFQNIQTNEGCGEISMDDEGEGPPGAVDLPDDPNEAFGIGYSAALGEVLAAIQGLMPILRMTGK